MSTEEDIGALKADMTTVKGQTSKIFETMNVLSTQITSHMATETAKRKEFETLIAQMKTDNKALTTRVGELEDAQKAAKWWVLGLGGGGVLGGTALIDFLKSIIR